MNKYTFTGDGFDCVKCLHFRDEIRAEGTGRRFGYDQGPSILYHEIQERYAIKQGDTAQECCEIGTELFRLGEFTLGMDYFRKAVRLDPKSSLAHSFLIIGMDYTGATPDKRIYELKKWAHRHIPQKRVEPHDNDPNQARRIRVGYVSGDFYRHSAFHTWYPIMREHDPEAVEVFAYYTGSVKDDYTLSMRQVVDNWRDVNLLSDDDMAALIRADAIDILIDLSGHTAGHRLKVFALKPAPIQMPAFGFLEGNGLTTTDYVWGDSLVLPQEWRRLIGRPALDIPASFFYEAPAEMPSVAPPPCTMGEPFTFGCFNKIDKITDDALRVWSEIILAVPGSRLILKDVWYDNPIIRTQLAMRLQRCGFPSQSLILYGESSHAIHARMMDEIDVALDPFPHGGGTSTAEMLWQGVPVVTLWGAAIPGRVGAAMVTRAGLPWLAVMTHKDYIETAAALARKDLREMLTFLRGSLRARLLASPLCRMTENVRAIEQRYREVWRLWCAVHNYHK